MIFNDQKHHHISSYHYTVTLYPGVKKYEYLKFILNPFLNDLRDLKANRLEIAGTHWHFELCFSSDWKFLAIHDFFGYFLFYCTNISYTEFLL